MCEKVQIIQEILYDLCRFQKPKCGFSHGPSQPVSYLGLKHTVGVSADCGGGEGRRREGAVQVHREGKLLHEYKSKERGEGGGGGMALAAASAMASRLISAKNIAKSSFLSSPLLSSST